MRVLTLLPSVPMGDVEPWRYSNSTGPSLDNPIIAQASSFLPGRLSSAPSWTEPTSTNTSCPALQPSRLTTSTTSSSLLTTTSTSLLNTTSCSLLNPSTSLLNTSTSSLLNPTSTSLLTTTSTPPTSTLLCTENTQFKQDPLFFPTLSSSLLHTENTQLRLMSTARPHLLNTENSQLKQDSFLSSSLSSPHGLSPLFQSTLPPAGGLLPACCTSVLPQEKSVVERKRKKQDIPTHSAGPNQHTGHEDLVEMDHGPSEMPVLDLKMTERDQKQTVKLGEAFEIINTGTDEQAELLKERKYKLLNLVCCSLVNKNSAPDQKDRDPSGVWDRIKTLATEITGTDPEFILKVAVYTRQELNIRITANFLLALAAHLPASKPHLRRYFCAAVQLPSDWLEVTRIYSVCFSPSLPSCLKKALTDKFKHFSEYQLAKYNTRKHRGKHARKKRKVPEPSPKQWETWANLVRSDPKMLKKFLLMDERPVMDKKQSEFNMKKLIKRLHVKEPAEFVMAILGKKYPGDLKAFTRSGLSGLWQSERAGQRMKLRQPDTWETRLSQEGNSAATWEKLIDTNSLPFMAMLRNLRNMITQGIGEEYHSRILKRLTSKSAVIQSRQFPFRFLSAYKVIMELSKLIGGATKTVQSSKDVLRGILKAIPKSSRYSRFDWSTAGRKRLHVVLTIPFIYRLYSAKRRLQQTASQRRYTQELLDRYGQALETSVQISCRYNIPPLSGCTLVIFTNRLGSRPSPKDEYDFCLPPDVSDTTENTSSSPSAQEAGLLLAMMISYCCEHSHFLLSDSNGVQELQLESDALLDNVRQGLKLLQEFNDSPQKIPHNKFFSKLLEEKTKVDNIILLDEHYMCWSVEQEVTKFRKDSVCDPLVVKILFRSSVIIGEEFDDPRSVQLCGFSEQILRFISERGSSRLLDHVERIDKLHNIPLPQGGAAKPKQATNILPLPATPKLRWRGVRVFISSTFRDMHGERDVLVRSVFPELRRRAAPHCLYLQEVELRWGVTEEESDRAVELCLSEVCRSQLLLGILGERYGLVPPRPALPNLPQHSWLDSAPAGISVTEMEIRQFQALYPDSAQERMMFYIRSPHLARSVPAEWKADFAAESKETARKMDELKTWIHSNRFRVQENYPCEWGGVVDGRPYVKGLEHFANAVMEDLWACLQKLFVEEADEADLMSEIKEQEVYLEAQLQRFHGRRKLLSMALEKVQECQQKGGILLVEGAPGEGKTLFMAALAHALRTPDKSRKGPVCDVISYSTAASQSASSIEHLLRCLVQWLRKRKEQEEELPSNTTYSDLLSEWHSGLTQLRKDRKDVLVLCVDGAEHVHDARGQGSSEWIPQHLAKGVCLVLSVTRSSPLQNTLSKKKGSVLFPLGQLCLPDRKEIVQKELEACGKKLSDSAFNNQLQSLMMKKAAMSPLYLHLACEELRNYATFDKMKASLQALPPSVCELVKYGLVRLQTQYCGAGLARALAALALSSTGLRERDLYSLLNLSNDLTATPQPLTWQEVLALARCPKSRVPMATFSHLARSLQSMIRPSFSQEPDEPLTLTNPDIRLAFDQLYLSDKEVKDAAHLILAAHLWVRSDPHGNDTFLHCDANTLVHLPVHLMRCGQWEALHFLLSSYYFLYANVLHGLLHPLLETYILFEKTKADEVHGTETLVDPEELQACHAFLKRHAPLLSHWPALFVQQALNEAKSSAAHVWATRVVDEDGVHAVRWLNTEGSQQESGELVSSFQWGPSCVTLSPAGGTVAVGTEQGTLHIFHTHTKQEVKSLVSNCDGISGCVFLDECVLGTTSCDGQVEVWDINSGCRMERLNAHSNRITGCDVSSDRKHFATVSLDFTLKVWSSQRRKEEASFRNPSPLNCVTFDPEGALLAVGCWDGAVRVWDWRRQENHTTLSGHRCSVRSVAFSPSSSLLCSGYLDGEVRLWSLPVAACVGSYRAHRGSTQALHFLSGGDALLSAGSDSMVQVWSAGLGRSVSVLGEEKKLCGAPASRRVVEAEGGALSVAVANGYAAVGYHGNGVGLFSLESGERVWSSEGLQVSVPCLLWLEAPGGHRLLAGASDSRLRLWSRPGVPSSETLDLRGAFGVQRGAVLALAQNSTYVASASDDFTIALWIKEHLTSATWVEPSVMSVLRGHNGGVTCLDFSPDGHQLLSGGKDKALRVWRVSSSPALTGCLPHCHGDWITSCAWTPSALLSCSTDCRLCLWDIQTGSCIREIRTHFSLSALCCWEDYVMVGSADGLLMVWKSDVGVIAEIQAHKSRLHHTAVIPNPATGELKSEDLLIATASDDGTVKFWRPLQVQHRSSLLGHSGAVQALVSGPGTGFLTVSEDRSLRAWSTEAEMRPRQMERVSAMCFLDTDELLVCGYSSGRLEMWKRDRLVYSQKVNDSCIRALTGMPNHQLAVGCTDCSVTVWKLEGRSHTSSWRLSLSKVSSYTLESCVTMLCYCTVLLGVCADTTIIDIFSTEKENHREMANWKYSMRILGLAKDGGSGLWLVGEEHMMIKLCYLLSLDPELSLDSCVSITVGRQTCSPQEEEDEAQRVKKRLVITAAATREELIVCGDCKGNMWFNQPPHLETWSPRRPVHSDRISVLRITDSTIITASYDRTVKLWDKNTKKQVGLFVCSAAVEVLEVDPNDPSRLVCGDALGNLYFLSWSG
ncbi:telomerase protein component 1-like [Brachyhypopomus gauderio]|uniref:telomerase protein component 1-like n=1 Tax=Brachyhypopomus gauderio TaxID=698409 RepID=UPI0040428CF5